jgi:2-dehydro-3-deoxyphosphogluconate aldolase / (4S)-4-hydroxy-2-oxoglutarate aldolase
MQNETKVKEVIREQGILPLFYHKDSAACVKVMQVLYQSGIRCIEFTNRGKNALANFREMVAVRNQSMNDMILGVGTIHTAEDANKFLEEGADFLISPFFDSAVCDVAYMNKVLWIPGCMTPTEIHVAQQAGCQMIKLFPGNTLGASYIKAITPVFPGVEFMVTGGVKPEVQNLRKWFNAGVAAVGMGSKLLSKADMEAGDEAALRLRITEVMNLSQQARAAQVLSP